MPDNGTPNIGLFVLDGEALNGYVEAGESADKTVRVVMSRISPAKYDNLVFWLETAAKVAREQNQAFKIRSFRDGVMREEELRPYRQIIADRKASEAPKPQPRKPDPPKKSLTEMFGV